ncbi:STAS domain-containing protein [Herbihabitans rhizosphaerae]|uniref:STAS domain-containing protein n=1 Tax=Herbihabitans rhizosphaerae TaxID=1872711 RepID=UPI003BF7FD4C
MCDIISPRFAVRSVRIPAGTVLVTTHGYIDRSNDAEWRAAVVRAAHHPATTMLVCDLTDVDFVSCGVLMTLRNTRDLLISRGIPLRLLARDPTVLRALTVSGLNGLLADPPVEEKGSAHVRGTEGQDHRKGEGVRRKSDG